MWTKLAKLIRAISIPPIVLTIFVVILITTKTVLPLDGLLLFIFLGLIQFLAYPLCYFIKPLRAKGRSAQRTLAFVLGIIGYTAGLVYAITAKVGHNLQVLYLTYFLSIIILAFINKVIKVKASGHMTSITGPIIGSSYFIGLAAIIPGAVFYLLVFWSSFYLKRHTVREMILGTLTVLSAFGLTLLILLI